MLAAGVPPSVADWICEDLKPRYLAAMANADENLKAFGRRVDAEGISDMTAAFFVEIYNQMARQCFDEIFKLEFELWLAKFGGDTA